MATFDTIFTMLRKASVAIKYPKIRFVTSEGHRIQLYLATKGYIAIKIDGEYSGMIRDEHSLGLSMRQGTLEVQREILAFCKQPVSEAKINGQKYGHCCFCALELTNAISVYNGYGPICAEKYGLPWEAAPEEPKEPTVEPISTSILGVL